MSNYKGRFPFVEVMVEGKQTIEELDRRLGIVGVASVVAGNGGLPKVRVSTPMSVGEIYLHGAHVTSWKPTGSEEVLFVSSTSRWEDGRAIRGGVPICFPWFRGKADDPKASAHGFVRTKSWQLESIAKDGDAVTVTMFTESDDGTKKWWPADFRLVHRATFGAEFRQELILTNTGKSALRFEEALHVYLKIADIDKIRILGLDGVHYLDNNDGNREITQQGDVSIDCETDRAYMNTKSAVELDDSSLRRRIRVAKENSLTTVVWNPWIKGAQALSDLGPNEWKQMICIEPTNIREFAVDVAPGAQHKMTGILSVAGY